MQISYPLHPQEWTEKQEVVINIVLMNGVKLLLKTVSSVLNIPSLEKTKQIMLLSYTTRQCKKWLLSPLFVLFTIRNTKKTLDAHYGDDKRSDDAAATSQRTDDACQGTWVRTK